MNISLNSASKGALILLLSLFSSITLNAQVIKCHTNHIDSLRHAMNPDLQTNEEFESWLAKEITAKKKAGETQLIINGVYQIPVIVHVIHDGEAIGTGTNISAATIQSQIEVLNEDFRKITGTPGDNSDPVGADTQIEFCLAKRRPDGTPFPAGEDGINRVNRNTVGWTAPPYNTGYIDGTIKPYTIATQGYDAAVYMNFWSVNISGGILGYAQFPTTVLGGMGCGAQNVNTDGVVMLYSSIGKSAVTGYPGPYNEGRTATHEIGHWLGLRHIWGDGGCGVDDYCNDTPLSDASNFGCPNTNSCTDPAPDPNDMVENYMDYSDDLCMNIFTYDQKMRMRTVLENSPIRASLITSDACIPPAVSDASIVNVLNPLGDNCPGSITPNVTLRNRGSSNLTSATIEYTIDGGVPTSFAWSGTINPGNEANVALPAFTSSLGIHTFRAYSLLPNTVVDPDPIFDTTTIQFAVSNGYQPDHIEDFEAGVFPPDVKWTVVNPNSDCISWVGQSCVSSAGVSVNSAALMTNYNNGTNQDEYLYTPIFILPCNATSADFIFDKAYKKRVNGSSDRLRVEISEDCGATWNALTLYDQSGNGLVSSAGNLSAFWIPGAAGDWNNVVLDLMPYVTASSKNVQFRFRATNAGNGGNLYVDNVEFVAVTPGEIEVTVSGLDVLDEGYYDYGSVPIGGPTTATFTIDNPGTSNLILTGPITIVGDPEFALNTTFGTTTVPAGGSTTFTVDFTPTGAGPYSAILTFGTNDCDEGTYNFELMGTGNVTPPTALFIASPTLLCAGSSVTYTDASTGATGWTWSFPNGTPNTATGIGPHVITYNTPGGPYDAQLDVVNAYGTDTDLQSGLITVVAATGTPLPITEGFVAVTFPPTNWSINNGGLADTWVRDGANGNAPTAGNSSVIDNFTNNTSGNIDDLVMPAADFTGLISAQLEFDVAYARYNATYFDQLQVVVSNDCGDTWIIEYDKAGTVLATDADQTAAYTPGTWRTETIDLTAYIGSGKVDIAFRSISGWGQFVYIDNVNLTGIVSACNDPDVPTITYAPATICDGSDATLTISGNLNDATDWYVYTGSCGGTAVGTTNTSSIVVTPTGPSTTYFIRGEGGCVVPATCGSVTVIVDPIEDATFSYGAATYCTDAADPTPTISGIGSGAFTSSPAGLSINGSTGAIDVSASIPNTYTVTYTTPGTCTGVSNIIVTINALPATPTILAGGPTTFCSGGSVDLTSSQASGNVWSTSETTQTINVNGTGNFTVTYTDGNSCSATSAITAVTLNADPSAPTITSSGPTTFCAGGSVDLTSSQASGNVWSTTETTQTINVIGTGSYSVTYTDGNGCSATSTITAVTVNANPAIPIISAGGPTTFCAGGNVTLTSSQGSGNVWSTSSTSNNIIVTTGGPYSVTYTDGNGCSATSATTNVTVNPAPVIAIGTILDPSVCATTTGSIQITGSGTGVVSWTGTATGNSGSVTLPYTITGLAAGSYNITFDDGCGSNMLNQTLTDPTPPATPTITAGGPTTFCAGGSVTLTSSYGSGNTWSTTETTSSINVIGSATISVTYTDGSGCSSSSAPLLVTVNASPAIPTISPDGPTTFCSGSSVNLSSSQATGNVWSTAETTQIINAAIAGPYSVTYTDGNGCSSTSAVTNITVNTTPSVPVISAGGPITFCAGGSVDLTSSQASGNVWSTTETTQTITVNGTGAYSVTYTAGNGCSATSAVTNVTVNPIPVISIGGTTDPTTCSTNTGSIQVSGSGTGIVSWTGTATGNSGSVSLPYSITGLGAGAYSITFDESGCTSNVITPSLSDPTPPATPNIVASGSTTFCAGGSVDLTSSYVSGNVWTTSETTQSITVNSTGTYSVTYTDGSGCSSTSAIVSITVNTNPAAPVITTSGPTIFCDGGSVDLTSSQASGNVWSTTETSQTVNILASGSFDVTYTDGNGCSATSLPTVVTVNSLPALPIITASGPTTFCEGGSVDLTSSQVSGNVWSTTETTQSINIIGSGSYTVTYSDGNGCSSNSVATDVTVDPLPIVSITPFADVCDSDTPFTLTGGTPSGGSYTGSGITANVFDPILAGIGSHTLTYTFTDGNGCSGSAQADIQVNDCAGIDEVSNTDISIYPNPTFNFINIISNDELIEEVRLYDAAGRLVKVSNESANEIIIDLSSYPTGLYNLEVRTVNDIVRSRVIKQ